MRPRKDLKKWVKVIHLQTHPRLWWYASLDQILCKSVHEIWSYRANKHCDGRTHAQTDRLTDGRLACPRQYIYFFNPRIFFSRNVGHSIKCKKNITPPPPHTFEITNQNKRIEDILDIDSHCPYLLFGETTSHLTNKWRGTFQ